MLEKVREKDDFFFSGRPGEGDLAGFTDPCTIVLDGHYEESLGKLNGRLNIGGVVEEDEGLEWSIGNGALGNALLTTGCIKCLQAGVPETSSPEGVDASSIKVFSVVLYVFPAVI